MTQYDILVLNSSSSIYKYEDAKEDMEWAVIDYTVNLTNIEDKIKSEYKQNDFDIKWKYKSKSSNYSKMWGLKIRSHIFSKIHIDFFVLLFSIRKFLLSLINFSLLSFFCFIPTFFRH